MNRDHIQNKVRSILEKKNKRLDVNRLIIKIIQERLNDDFNQNHPFCPKTNVHDKSHLGDLNEFLNSQYNHLKKVDENIKNLKEETDKKIVLPTKPKIDEVLFEFKKEIFKNL